MNEKPGGDHWLVRPENIRKLWIVFIAVLTVVRHPHFAIEEVFGFGAWYGFLACVVLVFFSKALGAILKRPDDYYDD